MNYFKQQSERLHFRKLTENDITAWTEFFIKNENLKFLGIDLEKSPETLATNWIQKQLERYETSGLGHLAVETFHNSEFIGVGGILPRILNNQQEYEIAYSLIPRFWNKGFGTEIAEKMRNFGLSKIKTSRFISIIDKRNTASMNVAKKIGMKTLFETEYLGMDVFVFGIDT